MMAFSRSTSSSRSKTNKANKNSLKGLTPDLDAQIKSLNRLIRKNTNLRDQIHLRASLLEQEPDIIRSPTRRAQELRSTALALRDENEMLTYKLSLRKRLRERMRSMRSAADSTWRAYGGRGKTRDLALAHAKISALQEEVEELHGTHLDALREGLTSRLSTNEAVQQLDIATESLNNERERRALAVAQTTELELENSTLRASVKDLRTQLLSVNSCLESSRVQEIRLKTSEQILRKSVDDEHQKTQQLKRAVGELRVVADQSQARERTLRVHVAAATAVAASSDPYMTALGGLGGLSGLNGLSGLDRLGGLNGLNSLTDQYLGSALSGYSSGVYTPMYQLSPTARRYYMENVAKSEALEASAVYESQKIRQIDLDLELATAVDKDVEAIRRARDRQRLAILRSEADLGLSSSANHIVERTLLESKMEVDQALGRSGHSYLSKVDVQDL